MNWRVLTIVNATLALITIVGVIFGVARFRPRAAHANASSPSSPGAQLSAIDPRRDARAPQHLETIQDVTDMEVDNLGAVAASELAEIMRRAKPEELVALSEKFNTLPIDAHTLGGLGMFFQVWAQLDPKAAMTNAFRLKDTMLRKLGTRVVVNSSAPSACPDLIRYLLENPDKDLIKECKGEFVDSALINWAYLDPEGASRVLDSLDESKDSGNYNSRSRIAYTWGTLDSQAALEWVKKQGEKEGTDAITLYDQVISGWADKDLDAASAYVEQHLYEPAAEREAGSVTAALFTHDQGGAKDWVDRLPAGPPRTNAEYTLARMWSQKDAPGAAEWMATLPPDEQEQIVQTVANNWISKDWTAASNWIGTLTGEARDIALSAAAQRDNATPYESLSLALQISPGDRRTNSISSTINQWATNDRSAAEAWIKTSTLSPEEQQSLLKDIAETAEIRAQAVGGTAEVERVIVTGQNPP